MLLHSSFRPFLLAIVVLFGVTSIPPIELAAQTVNLGKGSYSTTIPDGANGPSTSSGGEATPKISDSFDQLITTNDFWSSLIFPYNNDPHSNNIYAHPLNLKAESNGLQIGYSTTHTLVVNDYFFPFSQQLLVGVDGLTASETLTQAYGDWTVTALWENESASMEATFGHGLPYTFFTIEGGNAQVISSTEPDIWHNEDEVIGLSVDGKHYGLFAPTGSAWTGSDTLSSSLNGKDFFSVAVLPDTTSSTLELYRNHAYAFVTNSTVEWDYDENTNALSTTYTYETVLKDSSGSNSDETLSALYRHQWLNTSSSLTAYTYESPRGSMKVHEGNTFTTEVMFSGILPSLPDMGDYDRIQLLDYVQDITVEVLTNVGTYESGKEMGRFAQLVHIADQLGAINERDYFLAEMKLRLEEWFTAGGEQEYIYHEDWNALTGTPTGFGADTQLNDQHFHAGYAVMAAATIAQYDSAWASQENWGAMVNLLIRNASNWDRNDTEFPFLRNHDIYAGHSWAAGHADFTIGNNQESSSESMNYAAAVTLWGEMTGQDDLRDLGIFLYTTETEAIEQYWFDIDDEVFPDDYSKNALGIVWGSGGEYDTWFGSAPEYIHGINFLPITASSVYLGRDADYVLENYNDIVTELGGQPALWKDVLWSYLALSDPELAISYYLSDTDYEPFDGESKAHTLHWLYNLKEMGHFNTEVYADIATYSVFVNEDSDTTYTAYNAEASDRLVTFTDGFSFTVPAHSMNSVSTAPDQSTMESAPSPTIVTENVISIFSDTYGGATEVDYNPEEGQSTIASLEVIDGNNTLKYDSLDFQSILFEIPQNVSTRSEFHVDYWTDNATNLSVFLVSLDGSETDYEFTITKEAWQSVDIPLSTFADSVNLFAVSEIRFEGDGTVYIDNLYFSGDDPVPGGPQIAAPTPDLDPENVISIFSDVYENIVGTNFNPDWSQSTITSTVSIAGSNTLVYDSLDYQGTELGDTLDVSEMGWFHLDYWTEDATELSIYLISPGPLETEYDVSARTSGWQSIDIPLSEFEEVVDLTEIFQIKIEGNGTIYFDNLYFGKNPELTPAPTPTHDPDKVISLFSNTYENRNVDTWSASWDVANVEDILVDGDDIKYYTNLFYAGIEFFRGGSIDATNLTHFRFDLWTTEPTEAPATFKVKLVDFGANGVWSGGDDVEHELTFRENSAPKLVSNQWISFDIPIDNFVNMTTREHLSQLLFLGSTQIREVYIDNIYFYGDQVLSSNEEEENDQSIPAVLELSQNYPNPFNPTTNIEFGIPEASQVTLKIYNTLGQLVSTLMDSRLNPGSYSVPWDASRYTSGVYFYQLSAGGELLTKKMLLIK
ncbi:MAG: T9SS C-terminal target domain-containing protein [Balneola sp.]|nr:MAG: T9SS C-terminal target domain-containing protein [Balneola sp.]